MERDEQQGLIGDPVPQPSTNVSTQESYGSAYETISGQRIDSTPYESLFSAGTQESYGSSYGGFGGQRIGLATFEDTFSAGTQGSYGSAYEGIGGQRINLNFYESQFSASTYGQQRQTLLDPQHQVGPSFAQDSSLQTASYVRPSIIRNFLGRSINISSRNWCDEIWPLDCPLEACNSRGLSNWVACQKHFRSVHDTES